MVHTVGFEWGPNTRGTVDIIWSCVLVLVTAVWTVIHVNIPASGECLWRELCRKIRWGCVSVFAPDFLTLVASAQWQAASRSVAKMQNLPQLRRNPEKWRLEHAFYANSGGFRLQCQDCVAFPVNAESLHYLVVRAYISLPDITVSEIRDKSKADAFAKGAAIFQGLWLVADLIARTAQGLPSTQLELFTLAFVVSTVMSFFFWWRKPQHVSTTTLVLCDYTMARIRRDAGLSPGGWSRTPMDWIEEDGETWTRRDMFRAFDLEPAKHQGSGAEERAGPEKGEKDAVGSSDAELSTSNTLSQMDIVEIKADDRVASGLSGKIVATVLPQKHPTQRIPDDAILPSQTAPKVLIGIIIPSMVHSCIHLLGWNLHYPSTVERELWRVSAVTLTVASCVAVAAVRVLKVVGYEGRYSLVWFWVNASRQRRESGDLESRDGSREEPPAKLTIWEVLLTFATLALVLARLYIIVEVIVSLRSQPVDVYTSVNWLGFLPHV